MDLSVSQLYAGGVQKVNKNNVTLQRPDLKRNGVVADPAA